MPRRASPEVLGWPLATRPDNLTQMDSIIVPAGKAFRWLAALAVTWILAGPISASAQPTATLPQSAAPVATVIGSPDTWQNRQLARQLIAASGQADSAKAAMNQMLDYLERSFPQVPQQFWTDARAELSPEPLMEELALVYLRAFTVDEINGLIAFYQSPLGQQLLARQPQIQREAMAAGQRYGEQAARKLMAEIESAGKDSHGPSHPMDHHHDQHDQQDHETPATPRP